MSNGETLTTALREAVSYAAPVLIDVPVGEFDPWQAFFPRKRVRDKRTADKRI